MQTVFGKTMRSFGSVVHDNPLVALLSFIFIVMVFVYMSTKLGNKPITPQEAANKAARDSAFAATEDAEKHGYNPGQGDTSADASIAQQTYDAAVADKKATESNRRTNSIAAAVQLRDSMRNPDSFIVEQARANDDGSVVCLWYRSQNGFGGMNRAGAYMRKALLETDADATSFNTFCVADRSVRYDVLQAADLAVKHFHQ